MEEEKEGEEEEGRSRRGKRGWRIRGLGRGLEGWETSWWGWNCLQGFLSPFNLQICLPGLLSPNPGLPTPKVQVGNQMVCHNLVKEESFGTIKFM